MTMTFRAQKMLDRLEREGRMNEVDQQTIEFIKKLDGRTGNDYNWNSVVYGDPVVLLDDGETYVAVCDCD